MPHLVPLPGPAAWAVLGMEGIPAEKLFVPREPPPLPSPLLVFPAPRLLLFLLPRLLRGLLLGCFVGHGLHYTDIAPRPRTRLLF
jgi:hypothetical protein